MADAKYRWRIDRDLFSEHCGNPRQADNDCGVEGPSNDPEIERLRTKQIKNLFTINLLAFGVPMMVMGDEVRRSQGGNNNAYCQDNETSWLDWSLMDKHQDLRRFVNLLIAYRKGLPERSDPRLSLAEVILSSRVRWHGAKLDRPDWGENSRSVAFTIETPLKWHHLIFNAFWDAIDFELPSIPGGFQSWQRIIDTDRESPEDIHDGVAVQNKDHYNLYLLLSLK